MKFSKLNSLRQVKIDRPCAENWEAMEGDDEKRFCAGCGCHVHNLEAIGAVEAEKLLNSPGRMCTRIKSDSQKGILTRDGWVPRMLLAGAVVASSAIAVAQTTTGAPKPASVSSKQDDILGERVAPTNEVTVGRGIAPKTNPQAETGIVAKPVPKPIEKPKPVKKKPKSKSKKKRG
jgi:hypothetical protein